MRQALCMEEGNDNIICDEFEYPLDIRLVCYTFEYSTDLQRKWLCWPFQFKKIRDIRDLQTKVEALEKEKCETLKQTKQTQAETVSELICNDCDYKAF